MTGENRVIVADVDVRLPQANSSDDQHKIVATVRYFLKRGIQQEREFKVVYNG